MRDAARLVPLLFLAALAACHTPAWRVAEIHEQIATVNGRSRDAAVKRALADAHAAPSGVTARSVVLRGDPNACAADVIVVADEADEYTTSCNGLRNALLAGGAVDATKADGTPAVLIASEPLAGDASAPFELATTSSGAPLLVRARLNVVAKRKIWREGTCNFMPSPVALRPSARMFVVAGHPASEVHAIDVPYDGEDTEVVCDERVE